MELPGQNSQYADGRCDGNIAAYPSETTAQYQLLREIRCKRGAEYSAQIVRRACPCIAYGGRE